MDEEQLFAYLRKQKKAVLLDFLRAAFDEMTAEQCQAVFAEAIRPPAKAAVDGEFLREEIDRFRRESLARKYYAPFNVNSKNFMHVPAATREWCARFAEFARDASTLTARGEHAQAVPCFAILVELVEALDWGEEIIFAEEVGSWMIPTDEKAWLEAYLTSLAATATPEAFTTAAIPLLKRDSGNSFACQVYASALKAATPPQKVHLQAEINRQQIRTGPAS